MFLEGKVVKNIVSIVALMTVLLAGALVGCSQGGSAPPSQSSQTVASSAGDATSPEVQGSPSASLKEKPVEEPTDTSAETTAVEPSIMYLGQASVRIVTPEGKVIYVDPYAGEDAWYGPSADLVLVTHAHFDHNGLDRVGNRTAGCRVITQAEAVADGEHPTFDLGYATVVPVQAGFNAYHDVSECVGYVVELSDGTSVYLSGDTSTTDDMRDGTLAAMEIDYAFWCADGVYNMDAREAAEAARMVGAAHDIPYHNSTSNSGEMFDREAAVAFDAPNAMVLAPGEAIGL